MDYFGKDADTEQAITDIAVEHSLVTNYTSLVVMPEAQFSISKGTLVNGKVNASG